MDELQFVGIVENLEIANEPIQRRNKFENVDPFLILSEYQFLQTFRVSKELCRFIIATLTPFMRPQRRRNDLSIPVRVSVVLTNIHISYYFYKPFNRFW